MTGGLSGIEARAKRWNEKQVDELKRKRDATVSELQEIARKLRNIQTEQQVGSAIEGLESRLKFSRMDGDMTSDKLKKLAAERTTLEAERAANEKELNKLGKQIQSRVSTFLSFLKNLLLLSRHMTLLCRRNRAPDAGHP